MQTISASLHSWESKVGPLPPTPQPWLFQTSSLPNEDMVKDHLSASNLPMSFPQFPLKGKIGSCGKEPKASWHTKLRDKSHTYRGKCRNGEDMVTQLLLRSS